MAQTQNLKRPVTVLIALILINGGIACSLIGMVTATIPGMANHENLPDWFGPNGSIIGMCCFFGFIVALIWVNYKIWQGKNWARKLFLVNEVGSLVLVTGLLQAPIEPIYQTIDCIALVLLFWPSSSGWFKAMGTQRESLAAT